MDVTRYLTSSNYNEITDFVSDNWKLELWEACGVNRDRLLADARKAAIKMTDADWVHVIFIEPHNFYDKGNLL